MKMYRYYRSKDRKNPKVIMTEDQLPKKEILSLWMDLVLDLRRLQAEWEEADKISDNIEKRRISDAWAKRQEKLELDIKPLIKDLVQSYRFNWRNDPAIMGLIIELILNGKISARKFTLLYDDPLNVSYI